MSRGGEVHVLHHSGEKLQNCVAGASTIGRVPTTSVRLALKMAGTMPSLICRLWSSCRSASHYMSYSADTARTPFLDIRSHRRGWRRCILSYRFSWRRSRAYRLRRRGRRVMSLQLLLSSEKSRSNPRAAGIWSGQVPTMPAVLKQLRKRRHLVVEVALIAGHAPLVGRSPPRVALSSADRVGEQLKFAEIRRPTLLNQPKTDDVGRFG